MLNYFQYFKQSISDVEIPKNFDYPFYYEPTKIAKIASQELQIYLENQTDFDHNFGLTNKANAIGKMFGVLVVKNTLGELGYIAAVSGKLANKNIHKMFVPPVFDMLSKQSFFLEQEKRLNEINATLEKLENDSEYINLKNELNIFEIQSQEQILNAKQILKLNKKNRKILREQTPIKSNEFEEDLIKQSLRDKHEFRKLSNEIEESKHKILRKINCFKNQIDALKTERKNKSNSLQNQLFDQYQFLNKFKEKKSLKTIFEQTAFQNPPAAAGECAAPKLLQYAFLNDLEPICMAEFWWGDSPKTEIRKHQHYYPACTGKCEPILKHMLQGIQLNDNILLNQNSSFKEFDVLFEDKDIIVINKPEEFLSVPGIEIKDSVYYRIKNKYPSATGPLIVHRLDMSTSGILILALNKDSHKNLQQQFIKRKVIKRYVALLDGDICTNEGIVNLPLRVDLNDRPRQMVCYEHGKIAETRYKVIKRKNNKTLVHFYPITGRTHQLRVHSSHKLGLNTPIVGDDLYGKKDKRLCLHAEYLEIMHPRTKEIMKFQIDANFNL